MTFSIEVPDNYGYVILSATILPFITGQILSINVMRARMNLRIPYPNLYAIPNHPSDKVTPEKADAFNRVQRGHQNMLESISDFRFCALVGGLKYPLVCTVATGAYCLGNVLYQMGYSDLKLNVKTARLKKGGPIKVFAMLTVFGCSVSSSLSMIGVL